MELALFATNWPNVFLVCFIVGFVLALLSVLSGLLEMHLPGQLRNVFHLLFPPGAMAGVNKITNDMAKMAAQVPALFEALSGMNVAELFGKVRTTGDKGPTVRSRMCCRQPSVATRPGARERESNNNRDYPTLATEARVGHRNQ